MPTIETSGNEYTLTTNAPPTASQLAAQAAELQAQALAQAEQEVVDATAAKAAAADALLAAVRRVTEAKQQLREIKTGRKAKPAAEKAARKPRRGVGAAPEAFANLRDQTDA